MARLKDKVAVITGGGSGIGAACAELFAREGAAVVVAGRRAEPLEEVAARVRGAGGECLAVPTDVADEVSVAALFAAAVERFGRVDVLFNNAGVGGAGVRYMEDFSVEAYERVVGINLKGTMLCCKHVLPIMLAQGSGNIINNASGAGVQGTSSTQLYGPTKAAVINLAQAMAMEYSGRGIRVNVVSPGRITTPMTEAAGPEKLAELAATVPMGRNAEPLEVAYGVLFLASDESSYVSGANLVIDGALSAGRIVDRG